MYHLLKKICTTEYILKVLNYLNIKEEKFFFLHHVLYQKAQAQLENTRLKLYSGQRNVLGFFWVIYFCE